MEIERRTIPGSVEVRAAKDDKPTVIVGRAVVFNEWSQDLGGFRERIAPGAFAEILKTSDARALFNHNPDNVLGRQGSGTLRIKETGEALEFDVDIPDTTVGRDVTVSIDRGDITGNSFAFSVPRDGEIWEDGEDGLQERTVTKVSGIYDVGPVTYPAYEVGNTVSTRSLEIARERARRVPMARFRAKQRLAEL